MRSYWRKSLGLGVLFGVLVLGVLLVARIVDGDRSWLVGLIGGLTLLGIGMPLLVYWVHYRNSMAKFREMGEPTATFTVDEETFSLVTATANTTLKWESVKKVWGFGDFWLFLFSKAHFATIPLDDVPEEMRTFVLERVKRCGGRVAV